MASMLMASLVFRSVSRDEARGLGETVTEGRTIRNPRIITAYKFGWLQGSQKLLKQKNLRLRRLDLNQRTLAEPVLTRQVHLVRAHFVDRTDFDANRRLNPLLRQTCESHP